MEHFFENTIGENWFNYQDFYRKIVNECEDNSHFVEVGCWKGKSVCFLAVEAINSGKKIKIDCVDTWDYVPTSSEIKEPMFNNLYEIFLENVKPIADNINIIKSISWDAASLYEDESLDFVFIDAGHDYESVKKDISSWYPKIKKQGIIAGHDYHYNVGVYPAVNEFFSDKGKINTQNSCWYIKK